MKRFDRNIEELIELNMPKASVAKRVGCAPATLDRQCELEFGMTWDEKRRQMREAHEEELRTRPVGKLNYVRGDRTYKGYR